MTAWAISVRQPAFPFTSVIHNHPDVMEVFCHLDYAFNELMLKLPAGWLFRRNFYSFMIYCCVPKLRDIEYANTGKPLSGRMEAYPYTRSYVDRIASKVSGLTQRFTKKPEPPRHPPNLHYTLYHEDKPLMKDMREILHSFPAVGEILDRDKCLRFLCGVEDGALQTRSYSTDAELMGCLATLCYSFRYFNLSA